MTRARDSRGFSLVELAVVLLVVSILARIALPAYAMLRRHAVAAQAWADVHTIRTGALAEFDATGNVADPRLLSATPPPEMVPYLPAGFRFAHPQYQIYWLGDSVPASRGRGAIAVVCADPALLSEIDRVVRSNDSAAASIVGNMAIYDVLDATVEKGS